MPGSPFQKYSLNISREVENCYNSAFENKEEDLIHNFRVSLKKLRTLFSLLEGITSGSFNAKENFRFFKSLFKELGILRDLQVLLITIENYEKFLNKRFTSFKRAVRSREKTAQRNLSIWMNEKGNQKYFKALRKNISEHSKVEEQRIIDHSKTIIDNWVNKVRAGKNLRSHKRWHNHRRRLKRAKYLIEMINECYPLRSDQKDLLKKVRLLEEQLGNWHDLINARLEIRSFLNDQNEKPDYTAFVDNIVKDSRILLATVKFYSRNL